MLSQTFILFMRGFKNDPLNKSDALPNEKNTNRI